MKKTPLILSALLFAGSQGAFAQDIFDNPDNRAYLGVRLGLDISCPADVKSGPVSFDLYNPGAGFEAGAVYNIPVWKNLYFEPGLMLYYSTMKTDVTIISPELSPVSATSSARRFGFRVPLHAGYRFDFEPVSVSVFTGPRLTLPLVGRMHTSVKTGYETASKSENLYGDGSELKRVDLGWQFGAGVSFGQWMFEISGTVGMLDMYKGTPSMHESGVDLTVGYNF